MPVGPVCTRTSSVVMEGPFWLGLLVSGPLGVGGGVWRSQAVLCQTRRAPQLAGHMASG